MDKRTVPIVIGVLATCIALSVLAIRYIASRDSMDERPARIAIGTSEFEVSGLIWIALDQGYFLKKRLDVPIKIFPAGRDAVTALLRGDVDMATCSELVISEGIMNGGDLQAVASIAKSEFHYITGRRDRGIANVSDLKKKNIGLARHTSAEFYLGRYLQLNGIGMGDVTLVDIDPSHVADALGSGQVDAVITWDPHSYLLEKEMGEQAVTWPAQSGQMMYWTLVARPDYSSTQATSITRLLEALEMAERFSVNFPSEAKRIVRNRLKIGKEYVDRTWVNTRLGLSLEQGLIIVLEDQSRWMMDNRMTRGKIMPFYPEYISLDCLLKVKPASVTVIREGQADEDQK